jgi:hypothetical protein
MNTEKEFIYYNKYETPPRRLVNKKVREIGCDRFSDPYTYLYQLYGPGFYMEYARLLIRQREPYSNWNKIFEESRQALLLERAFMEGDWERLKELRKPI